MPRAPTPAARGMLRARRATWHMAPGPLTAMRNIAQHAACRDPGSNQGPSDLQSDALPTELSRLNENLIDFL